MNSGLQRCRTLFTPLLPCRPSGFRPLVASRFLRLALALVLAFCAAVPSAAGASVEVLSDVLRLDASELPVTDQDVAALPDGGWVAVWEEGHVSLFEPSSRVVARRFDSTGQPVGAEWVIATDLQDASPRVAVTAEGRIFCVAWRAVELRLRCPALDDAHAGLAVEETVVRAFQSAESAYQGHDVSGRELLWGEGDQLRAQPLPQDGGPLPPQRVVTRSGDGAHFWYPVIADGDADWQRWEGYLVGEAARFFLRAAGGMKVSLPLPAGVQVAASGEAGLLTWVQTVRPSFQEQVVVQPYYASVPSPFDHLGPRLVLDERTSIHSVTAAYAPPADAEPPFAVVAWLPEIGPFAYRLPVRLVDVTGTPLAPPVPLLEEVPDGTPESGSPAGLAVHRLADGRFLATWLRGFAVALGGAAPRSQSSSPLHARLFAARPGPPEVMSLAGGRFAVRVEWTNPYGGGGSGAGRPRLLTGDTGAFWFFRPDNLELLVKVLDGRAVNGHWWVFYGGLSSVELTIVVDDLFTGRRRTYHKPPFELASAADTMAFAGTDGTVEAAARPGPAPLRSAVPASTAPDGAAGPCTDPVLPVTIRPGLCLHDRFEVEVEWATPSGTLGVGEGEPLTTDSGYLWFFRRGNAELLVKVLDGRPVNGHWWVFSGALSNVAYTLTVRDTESGEELTFSNPQGTFRSFADTLAFR